jgi:hypothetical protein
VDRRLRRQLAEELLAQSVEDLDAHADEASRHPRADLRHGDADAAALFVSGQA